MAKVDAVLCISEYKPDLGFGLPALQVCVLLFQKKMAIIKIYKQDMKTTFTQ